MTSSLSEQVRWLSLDPRFVLPTDAMRGLGWAGLASAKTYHQLHPERSVLILDRDSTIGGVWSEERLYPGLKTNNLVGTYEYPDFPMVPEEYGIEKGQHVPGRVVHEYLARYAERFGLEDKIRYGCRVESAEHLPGGGWRLRAEAGRPAAAVELRARRLVVATGLASEAFLPRFEGEEEFGAPLFHSRELSKHADTLERARSVAVLGGAKSAWDAVYAYASRGVRVDWIIRGPSELSRPLSPSPVPSSPGSPSLPVGRTRLTAREASGHGPAWHAPPYVTPFKRWLEQLAHTRALTWLSPCTWGHADGYPLVRRLLHENPAGRAVAGAFWRALGGGVLAANAYGAHPETAKLRPWSDAFFTATSLSVLNYDADFFGLVRAGGVRVHVADLARLSPRTVHLSDGTALGGTDLLVCATGWRHAPPLRFLPEGVERELGLPRAVAPAAPAAEGDEPYWRRDLVDRADAEILARFPRLRDQPARTGGSPLVPLAAESAGVSSRDSAVDPSAVGGAAPYHLYRFLVPPSPALLATRDVAFAGFMTNFVHAVVAHVQGIWITAYFDGELPPSVVPPPSDARAMEELCYQTVLHSRFGRWRYPAGHGHQFPDFVFDTLPYIDLLLSDLGLVAHRKNGRLAEIMEPYGPADYKDLVPEWRQKKTS